MILKRTPGPWEFDQVAHLVSSRWSHIATIWACDDSTGNGTAMAAVPEMIHALLEAKAAIVTCIGTGTPDRSQRRALNEINLALTKAGVFDS